VSQHRTVDVVYVYVCLHMLLKNQYGICGPACMLKFPLLYAWMAHHQLPNPNSHHHDASSPLLPPADPSKSVDNTSNHLHPASTLLPCCLHTHRSVDERTMVYILPGFNLSIDTHAILNKARRIRTNTAAVQMLHSDWIECGWLVTVYMIGQSLCILSIFLIYVLRTHR
jgi:hypothetical protein